MRNILMIGIMIYTCWIMIALVLMAEGNTRKWVEFSIIPFCLVVAIPVLLIKLIGKLFYK